MVIMKTISWAIVSGLIIGTCVYVETGSFRAAFMSAIVSASLKTPVYTIHEMIWKNMYEKK